MAPLYRVLRAPCGRAASRRGTLGSLCQLSLAVCGARHVAFACCRRRPGVVRCGKAQAQCLVTRMAPGSRAHHANGTTRVTRARPANRMASLGLVLHRLEMLGLQTAGQTLAAALPGARTMSKALRRGLARGPRNRCHSTTCRPQTTRSTLIGLSAKELTARFTKVAFALRSGAWAPAMATSATTAARVGVRVCVRVRADRVHAMRTTWGTWRTHMDSCVVM